MSRIVASIVSPPRWGRERLALDRDRAIEAFREERMKEPLEKYLEAFEVYRDTFDELLEATVDLRELSARSMEVLTDDKLCEAVRYLPAPPISLDDLKVVAQVGSLSPSALRADSNSAFRIVETILMGLDRRRFPWLSEDREASEQERRSAVLASAALLTTRKVETARRNEGKQAQEQRVREILKNQGLSEVPTRPVHTLSDAPSAGQFCMESLLGKRKADIIIGLWNHRVMAIECKVSNSATNSIKRLNNDAAAKAQAWRQDFGETQVFPAAVLSGVFNLKNLEDAQDRHLTIFWSHSLDELLKFVAQTGEES